MRPRLPKTERKALRFAYDLICGKFNTYFTYTHGLILHRDGKTWSLRPAGWIEPDLDPERPFLNESTFTHLLMHGYFECEYFAPTSKWLYRLSREGCRAMEWEWPNEHNSLRHKQSTPFTQHKLQEEFRHRRNGYPSHYPQLTTRYTTHNLRQHLYHRLHK